MLKHYYSANTAMFLRTLVALVGVLCVSNSAPARDSIEREAADTVEVFVYGQQSQNEDLLREISKPKDFEDMRKARAESDMQLNENVTVEDVEITQMDGDRATAKATYSTKHSKSRNQADVHLQRVDGKWQVTKAPNPTAK
jgi:hypothetical protein